MSDVGFTLPEKRWDRAYSAVEFIPQSDDVFARLTKDCDAIHDEADVAVRALSAVNVPAWKGAAAQVFLEYVAELASYSRTLREVAIETRDQVEACRRAIVAATADAGSATTALNKAQDDMRTLTGDDGTGLSGVLHKTLDLPQRLGIEHRFGQAFAAANQAGQDALDAMNRLAAGLDHPDATISALRAPEPPSVLGSLLFHHLPPDQIPLLQALFGPVDAALEAHGATGRAQDALDAAQSALDGGDDDKQAYLDGLGSLSPQELAYVLDHLDEDDVAALLGSLDPKTDRETYNRIAEVAPAELLARLGDTDPNHYWHPYTGQGGKFGWEVPTGLLPGQVPTGDPSTLQQGMLGDCHVLASLAAAERANPGFLQDHVQANANGSYTVTLYKDGKPIQVVVTAEFPFTLNADGTRGQGAYAHGSLDNDQTWTSDATLYMIYEKALAQTWGETDPNHDGRSGYEGMNGGWPQHDMPVITGHQMDNLDSGSVTIDQIRSGLDGHQPVTVTTLFEPGAGSDPLYAGDNVNQAIAGHEYYVIAVNGTPPDATVVLANPWGAELPGTGTITLSWAELQHSTTSVQIGK
ncbi:MAG: C2 family cysteine protease [Nocardioidaceae bacterium]